MFLRLIRRGRNPNETAHASLAPAPSCDWFQPLKTSWWVKGSPRVTDRGQAGGGIAGRHQGSREKQKDNQQTFLREIFPPIGNRTKGASEDLIPPELALLEGGGWSRTCGPLAANFVSLVHATHRW